MPRRVDHDQRREQIADAVCRLAARDGLDAVSLRHVAAEAGVSMGLVQHYFTTKDQLLRLAVQVLSDRVETRIVAAIAAAGSAADGRAILAAMFTEMMPISEPARQEVPVWIAFLARSIIEPRTAEGLRRQTEQLRQFVADQIRAGQHAGHAPAELDAVAEATALLGLVDGLMIHVATGQLVAEQAVATLHHQINRTFTGSSTHCPVP